MSKKLFVSAMLGVAFTASQSLAAAWVDSSPTGAFVNSSPVAQGGMLVAGTVVIVGQGSGDTVIRFSPACAVTVAPGSSYTIPDSEPCGSGLGGAGVGGISPAVLGVGALVAGVGAAAVVAANNKTSPAVLPYISK